MAWVALRACFAAELVIGVALDRALSADGLRFLCEPAEGVVDVG